MKGAEDSPVSFRDLWECLPDPSVAPFSFLHPAALLLFSDRLSYFFLNVPSFGRVLVSEVQDGLRFLPLPPPFLLAPGGTPEDRKSTLDRFMDDMSDLARSWPVPSPSGPRIDNCPMGIAGAFSAPVRTDTEYVTARDSLLLPSGGAGRSVRWELNRFSRDHPGSVVRGLEKRDLPSARKLVEGFVRRRHGRTEDPFEQWMSEDMGSAFDRAIRLGPRWDLLAWVVEERGRITGVQWYGLSRDGKTLVCYLEAREEGMSNLGTFMTRQVLLGMKSVLWVNNAGSGGLPSIDRSKKTRRHGFEIPLFTVSR